MSKKFFIPLPKEAPTVGEVYQYFKTGNTYAIVELALHSSDDEWMVIYKPMYECEYKLFTRPLRQWSEVVEWQGKKRIRFEKI